MTPIPSPDDLGPANALLAAVKPIYLVALGAVVIGVSAMQFVGRVEAIERDIGIVKTLMCRQPQFAHDSACRGPE